MYIWSHFREKKNASFNTLNIIRKFSAYSFGKFCIARYNNSSWYYWDRKSRKVRVIWVKIVETHKNQKINENCQQSCFFNFLPMY